MAKNGPKGKGRLGSVNKRSQMKNPLTWLWQKRHLLTGMFIDDKTTGGKFKGVRRES